MAPIRAGWTERRDRLAVIALAIVASAGLMIALHIVKYLPTHDGPQHVLTAHLENHYSDPGSPYPDYYFPTRALVAKGFALLYTPLEAVFPWRLALQLTLSLILLAWGWGVLAFVSAVEPRRRALGLIGFATAFQWSIYMGFFSYVLSTAVGWLTLAVAFRARSWWWKHRVGIAGLLLVQAIFHIFAAEAVALVLIVLVMVRAPWRQWWRELGLLALMGLPTMYMAAYAAGWVGTMTRSMPNYQENAKWLPWLEKLTMLADAFTAGPWWRAWPPLALAMVGLGFGAWRAFRGRASPEEKTVLIVAPMFLVTAVTLPLSLPNWEFMSPRFSPVGTILAIALIPLETLTSSRARGALVAALATLAGIAIGWAGLHNRDLDRACGPVFAGLDQPIKRRGPRLPIILDSTCTFLSDTKLFALPYTEPAWNAAALYAVQQGGIVPYTFTGVAQLHSLVMTNEGRGRMPIVPDRLQFWGALMLTDRVADAPLRKVVLTNLAVAGAQYEDIIFYGHPDDRHVIEERGWATDWSQGYLWIAHYTGCPTTVEIGLSAAQTEPLIVEWGWAPEKQPIRTDKIAANTAPHGGVVHASWEGAGCGEIWVRVGFDRDGSGAWKPGDGRCEGAGEDGKLSLVRNPDTKHIVCRLR